MLGFLGLNLIIVIWSMYQEWIPNAATEIQTPKK